MSNPWIKEFWRVITLGFLALAFGLIIDQAPITLLCAVLLYLGWHIYNLYRLQHWISQRQTTSPPDAQGIWGEVFYHIYKLQRSNRKRKKKLANMLARFQESTSAMPDATLVLNAENEIEWFNKAAKHILVDNLVRTPAFVNYITRGNFRRPLEIFSPDNKGMRLSISFVGYGKSNKLMIVRDVTRLHQLENMRRDFVANVSHELKTPLTVINGYLENLLDQMHQQSGRMSQIVNDLLLLSRLETDEDNPSRDPIAVPALIAAIVEDLHSLIKQKKQAVELDNDFDLWLQGSEKELYSAFSNLIVNAVKYTPEGGSIKIRWQLQGGQPYFEVTDSGIGVARDHIPRLTERFYRVDKGRSRDQGGTGLGLAIVKHVMIRHNAKLIITSEMNKGSSFRCAFPTDRAMIKEKSQAQGL